MELLSAMLAPFSKGAAMRVRISNIAFVADVQDLLNGMIRGVVLLNNVFN